MSIDKNKPLRELCDHFEQRKIRATERLAQSTPRQMNFAVLGIDTNIERFEFTGIGEFRRVIEPPGEVELASALKDREQFGAIGRYSNRISHEFAVNRGIFDSDDQTTFDVAWLIISALRVKTLAEFLVPAVSDYSWSVIAGLAERQCSAQLLEDVPQARRTDAPVVVVEDDFKWVHDKLLIFKRLTALPKVRLAVEALTTHQHLLIFAKAKKIGCR